MKEQECHMRFWDVAQGFSPAFARSPPGLRQNDPVTHLYHERP